MNAFCVDFSEVGKEEVGNMEAELTDIQAPIPDSFRRARDQEEKLGRLTEV